jgi:hypothetical protein
MQKLEVFSLVMECRRLPSHGLPPGATGARLLCYSPGLTLDDAVEAASEVARRAGLEPLQVEVHGSLAERRATGEVCGDALTLMEQAAQRNAVVIADLTPRFGPGPA